MSRTGASIYRRTPEHLRKRFTPRRAASTTLAAILTLACALLPASEGHASLRSGVPAEHTMNVDPPLSFPGLLISVDRPWDGSSSSIWTIVPGSSQVTQIASAKVPIIAPVFSPSGDEIAYNRDVDYRYTDKRDKLVFARPDGSDMHVLRAACSDDCHWFDDLDWAPDGQTLLMWRCVGTCPLSGYHSFYAIWSIRTDGTDLHQLTFPGMYTHTNKLNDHDPDVSPDGGSFVFDRLDDATGRFTLETAPMAGGEPVAIALPNRLDPGAPTWTPDGSEILFQSPPDPAYNKAVNLYTVRPDGTDLQQITHYHVPDGQHFGGVFHPSYSPDGSYIAVTHMFRPQGLFSYVILTPDGQQVARFPIGPNLTDMEWGAS
jgi:Tol biopolymer transport system component